MTIAVQIISILFMLTLMFIGIWSFVIANKTYNQLKYKNYLLEKISNHFAIITEKLLTEESNKKEEKLEEEEDQNQEENLNISDGKNSETILSLVDNIEKK